MAGDHLELEHLKILGGRLIYLEEYERRVETLDAAARAPLRSLLSRLGSVLDTNLAAERALDDDLRKAMDAVSAEVARWAKPEERDPAAGMCAQLASLAHQLECASCAEPREPCRLHDGRDHADNERNVADKGLCIAPLKEQFVSCVALARVVLARFAPRLFGPVRDLVEPVLVTRHTLGKPHFFDVPYGVTGSLDYRDRGATPAVELRMQVKQLDVDSYWAITYVLLHELLCHAWDGAEQVNGRKATSETDPFAEGWMDYVTILVLEEWANRRIDGAPPPPAAAMSRLDVARSFHAARIAEGRQGQADLAADYRAFGNKAAHRCHDFLLELRDTHAELGEVDVRDALLGLSFQISLRRTPGRSRVCNWIPPTKKEIRRRQKFVKMFKSIDFVRLSETILEEALK